MSLLRTLLADPGSIFAGRPPPDSITILSNKDASIDQLNGTTNYGGASSVVVTSWRWVGNPRNWRALVSFPLTGIPGGASIESATLKLYAFSIAAGRTYQVQRITGIWTEMGVTWNTQPAVDPTTVEGASPSAGGFWEIDVTDIFVLDSFIGLRVKDKFETDITGVKETDFYSRERAGTDQDPRLVVEYYS